MNGILLEILRLCRKIFYPPSKLWHTDLESNYSKINPNFYARNLFIEYSSLLCEFSNKNPSKNGGKFTNNSTGRIKIETKFSSPQGSSSPKCVSN